MSSSRTGRALLAALTCLAPLAAHAQSKPATPASGAFVVRLGNDTLVVERYVRTTDRLESWSVNRSPATIRRHYVVTLDKGVPVRMEYDGGRADGSQPMTKVAMTFANDTSTMTFTRGDSTQTMKLATPGGAIPAVGNSFALTELAIERFLAGKTDSAAMPLLQLGAPRATPWAMKKAAGNKVVIDYFGSPWYATLDAKGHLQSLDGSASTTKVLVQRVKDVDVEGLTQRFAQRDQQGHSMGVASPADSVRVTIGDAKLAINYSRPSRRGRALLGGIIPFDSVWRTGANSATMLTTSATLDIGGSTVPAGSYTLWTVPSRTGWQLVVNKQTGQWGTVYDAKQDLARIPMTVNKAAAGPEQFTMAIEPTGASTGTLRLTWGDIDVSVPVTVKVQAATR